MVKVLIGALSIAFVATANCSQSFYPYVGVDAQLRHTNFRNIELKKNYPQGNVFVGAMFNPHIGFELGYTFSKQQYKTTKFNSRIIQNDNPRCVVVVYDYSHITPIISGLNLNLVGSVPITDDVNFIGSVGRTHLKIQVKNVFSNHSTIRYEKKKTVLRLTGGVQFKLIDCVGLRSSVVWENSSSILLGKAKLKNSIQYSLGMFLTFR